MVFNEHSLLFLHRDNQCWPDCSTSLQTTGLPRCHCQRYQSKGMFSVTNVFIFGKRISVEIFLAGCNTRPGGTDVQRSIHWQRRHVEIKKVFGRLLKKCLVGYLFCILNYKRNYFHPVLSISGKHLCLCDTEGGIRRNQVQSFYFLSVLRCCCCCCCVFCTWCGLLCRAQASELWLKGEKVTCGYISEDTRVRMGYIQTCQFAKSLYFSIAYSS